ncbi:FtsH protease activity modulator HflK [Candidatus Altiarchaeota archaeon]
MMAADNNDLKKQTALISLAVNIFLVITKALFAFMSNTSLLFLDSIHSFVDSLASILAYASIRISGMESRKDSRLFKQVENLASILISFIVLFGAYEVGRRALEPKLMFADSVPNFPLAIIGTLISIGVLYFISRYKIDLGSKTGSQVLIADGYDSKMDLYSSLAVLVSLLGTLVGISLNKVAGVMIAILIAKLGIEILVRSVKSFLNGLYHDMDGTQETESHASMIDLNAYLKVLKNVWKYAIIIGLAIYLMSGIYVIESDEEGIVLRFGKQVADHVQPGLHYHIPYPIESVLKTKITKVERLEFGFRYEKSPYGEAVDPELWESMHGKGSYRKVPDESLMVTGDENIVDLNLIVQYKVGDSSKFLLRSREPERIIRDVIESSVRQVMGAKLIDDALTGGKMSIQAEVEEMIQKTLDSYDTGIDILAVQLQDVHPPLEVADAFKDVASAREDKNRIINDANSYRNDVLPKARGNAQKIIHEAQAYKAQRINNAMGEADKFTSIYEQYRMYRNTTRTRLYLEAMEEVLSQTRLYIIDPEIVGEDSIDYPSLMLMKDFLRSEKPINDGAYDYSYDQEDDPFYEQEDEEDILLRAEKSPTFW